MLAQKMGSPSKVLENTTGREADLTGKATSGCLSIRNWEQ
jgi:hypothetical protein